MPREIRTLTGLRFVAIWGAVAGQLYFLHDGLIRAKFPGQSAAIAEWVETGQVFADVFFCLSGLVLTYRYGATMGTRLQRARIAAFASARVARIWPVYLICLITVFAILVIDHIQRDRPKFDDLLTPNLVRQVLLVQDWFEPVPYDSSWILNAWVISAIMTMSIAFPLLILPVYRAAQAISSRGRLIIAILIPTPIVVLVVDGGGLDGDAMWLLRAFCFFTSGMLLATVITEPAVEGDSEHPLGLAADHRSWTWPLLGLLTVATVAALAIGALSKLPPYSALLGGVVPLVGLVAVSHPVTRRTLGNEPIVHGGRVAYSFSLAQAPILIAIWAIVPDRWAEHHLALYVALLLAGLAVAWLAAEFLWRRVETPARTAMTISLPPEGLSAPLATTSHSAADGVGHADQR